METRFLFLGLSFFAIQATAQDLTQIGTQKPVTVSGAIDVRAIGYNSKGIAPRRSPLSWVVSGSPTIALYGIRIPISFTFTEQERSFSQPFNQFGLSPTYKWITVHGGYRNISFSPYTLAGHTMLGGGVELSPGKLRFGLMTGRLNRATTVDTTTGAMRPYSFSRYGTAVKVGYGTEASFIDLSFLQAKDREKDFGIDRDSARIRPSANSVLGSSFKVSFLKKFEVFGDGGISVYTRDSQSDLVVEIDSTRKFIKSISDILKVNGTTEYYVAYNGGVGYTSKHFSLKLIYKYVDPNFQSMGAYFFQDDLRNITLNPSFNALNGKLRFAGSFGIQKDNVKKQKAATTSRIIGLANLSWDITDRLGLDANYANYTSNAEPTVTMVENRYLLAQTNSNVSVTPRLILPGKTMAQVVILSYNLSSLKDLNKDTLQAANILSQVVFLNHNLTLNSLGLTISSGLNYTSNELAIGTIKNYSANLGFSKSFLKNKLALSSSNSYIVTKPMQGNGRIWNLGGNLAYMPAKGHRFALRVNAMDNSLTYSDREPIKYSELTGELGYTFNF
ncbi:outer membrane beta-barrel family protein [Dyadobacter sp. CY312]|uniref:outer membrane beta-barrel family protein n=1 Tax=Dyadobacter sp. CY312 TaxID=2907303 RepID=UPI001F31EABC|nr:outer membrane beta-barrel family protein [Dyadobacter sp. CY312]MCE7042536.1 outer membrane beta-barrel family protein [Dyadobacter sp. CY312]